MSMQKRSISDPKMKNLKWFLLNNGSCTINSLIISSNVWSSWMVDLFIISLGVNDNGEMIIHN